MNNKNSFVLRTSLAPIVSKLSDKQAGSLFKAVLNYMAGNGCPEGLNDDAVAMAWDFIKQDLDYNTEKYSEIVQKRKAAAAQRWNAKNANAYFAMHNDNVVVNDVVVNKQHDNNKLLTSAPSAPAKPKSKPKKELNNLQKFSNAVIENFEAEVKTDAQKEVWFKRNCRCLSDILNFCGGDIPLAVETIDCCLIRLEKKGYQCGYEAVCRNLPDYYAEAKKKLGGAYAA